MCVNALTLVLMLNAMRCMYIMYNNIHIYMHRIAFNIDTFNVIALTHIKFYTL